MKNIEDLLTFDTKQWCGKRPKPLIDFLYTVCGLDIDTADHSQILAVSKSDENMYNCLNKKSIFPNHFVEQLLSYSLTNSKTFLNSMADRSPGGSYTYINNWLKNQTKDPLVFPNGLSKCVFDNSQKAGKTHLISATNEVPTTVITSQLWITFEKENEMQKRLN